MQYREVPNTMRFSDVFTGKRKGTLGTNGLSSVEYVSCEARIAYH